MGKALRVLYLWLRDVYIKCYATYMLLDKDIAFRVSSPAQPSPTRLERRKAVHGLWSVGCGLCAESYSRYS